MLKIKNISTGGDLDFNGINLPYLGDWVEVSDDIVNSIASLLYDAFKNNLIAIDGNFEEYLRKDNMNVLTDTSDEDLEFISFTRKEFINRILRNYFRANKSINDGLYDDLTFLLELKLNTKNNHLKNSIDNRIKKLKREFTFAQEQDFNSH